MKNVRRKITATAVAALMGFGLAVAIASPAAASVPTWYVNIIAAGQSKCLDVKDVSYANGALTQLYDCLGSGQYNQQFYLNPISVPGYRPETYQVIARHSQKCLDVKDVSQAVGALVQQWDCLGASQLNQIWQVSEWQGGYLTFTALHSIRSLSFNVPAYNGSPVFQAYSTYWIWYTV